MGQAVPPSQRSCDTVSSHPREAVPQAELRDGVPRGLILLLSQAAHNVRSPGEWGWCGGSSAPHIWALLSDEPKKPFGWERRIRRIAATAAGLRACTFLSDSFLFEL